ncbi:MAG: hypothetical protein HDS69_10695 [Bacteroidales bacterium]|nr:hypothetical protein [Bacteroidales bacterium]
MYSVYKKMAAAACVAAVAAMSLSSCKGANNEGAEAQIAFDKAKNAYNGGNARLCLELLDSVDSRYSHDIDVMKQSMKLRPKALIILTEEDLAAADSTVNANKVMLDSLRPLMTHVAVPGTEGYSVKTSAVDPSFMNKTGVSPRVSEIGEFYLVSSVNPAGGLQHWSLSAVVGDMIATTDTVPYDGTLNFRTNNSEVITFTPAGSNGIGQLVADNPGLPVKIIFNGQNGRNRSISLTAEQIDALATAYRYAAAVNDMRNATIDVERLNARHAKLQQQTADE